VIWPLGTHLYPIKTSKLTCILECLLTIRFARTISTVTYLWVMRKGAPRGRVNDSKDKGGTSTSEQGSCSHLSLLMLFILTAKEGRRERQRFGPPCVLVLRQNAHPFHLAPPLAKAKRHGHQEEH